MQSSPNPYESQKTVDEYLAFHYSLAEEYMVYMFGPKEALDFPKRCAELCLKHKAVRTLLVTHAACCYVHFRSLAVVFKLMFKTSSLGYRLKLIAVVALITKSKKSYFWLKLFVVLNY